MSSSRIPTLLTVGICATTLAFVAIQRVMDERSETVAISDPPPELDHPWPPVVGERYPDMALHDLEGRLVRLSSLAGKVLLISPIGTTSPGSIGFEGGPDCEPLAGFAPQGNVQGLQQLLTQHGVPLDHEDLVTVHLLLYSTMHDAPTPEQARQWVKHFGLDERSNAVVLVGDRRYIRQETLRMIPGIQLVDRDFILRADGGGIRAPDNIYSVVIPTAARELGVADPTAEGTLADLTPDQLPPTRPAHPAAATLFALLTARDYAGLERECARLRARGRVPGGFLDQLSVAYEGLLEFPTTRDHLDAWCAGAPDSAYAHLVRGEHLIDFAWEARGGGWGNTVSDEGWLLYANRLNLAKAALERAAELDPKLPFPAAALITLGMGQGDELGAIFEHFKTAVRADPLCMKAYLRMVTPLLPRWGGNEKRLFRFVRQAIASAPDDPAMQVLLVDAHKGLFTGDARSEHLSSPKVKAELDRTFRLLEKAFPESASIWTQRARVAWYQGDLAESQRCALLAVKVGASELTRKIAVRYEAGLRGLEKNTKKALELYCQAARRGDLRSYYDVARIFKDGIGVRRNGEAAFAWASRGAHGGDVWSMLLLGNLYLTGRGTDRNLKSALEWYRKSASGGNAIARKYLPKFLAAHPELDR